MIFEKVREGVGFSMDTARATKIIRLEIIDIHIAELGLLP